MDWGALLFSVGLLIVFILAGRQRLEVTTQGLIVQSGSSPARHLGTIATLRWEDAQLFFIQPRLRPTQDRLPTAYELSSASVIVRWDRMRRPMRLNLRTLLMKPAGPFDAYDQQMEALLSLIAAKTGLPLYDGRLSFGAIATAGPTEGAEGQ